MNYEPKIMIVEDDPIQIKLIEKILSSNFPTDSFSSFPSPNQALEYLKENSPDIIILDLYMSQINGFDFIDALKELFSSQRKLPAIIVCTVAEDKDSRSHAFQKGVMDYIIKPFTPEEILSRLQRVLDFQKLEKKFLALQKNSLKDSLTGLWNRKALDKEMERIYELSERYKMDYSVMMIDLDEFKKYNDNYGHLQGDEALKTLGEVILKNIRKSDFAGRFGGEEFLVIMPYTNEKGAYTLGWRLLKDLMEKKIPHKENPPFNMVTFTGGVAVKEGGEDILTVIRKADEALYFGKKYKRKVVSFRELIENGEDPDSLSSK